MRNKSNEQPGKLYEMLGMAHFQGLDLGRKLVKVYPVCGCRTWYQKRGHAEVLCGSIFGV